MKKHEGGEGTEIVRVPFPATTVAKTQADFESRADSFRAMRKYLDSGSSVPRCSVAFQPQAG